MKNLDNFKDINNENPNQFYNADYKLTFLDKHSDKPQDYNFYKRLFIQAKELEEEYNRDLCNFSGEDISEVIASLHPSTSAAAAKNIAMIKRYLIHAAQDGEKMTNIIQINSFTHSAIKFIPTNPKYYISEYELQLIEDSCINPQDAFLFRAVFEGVLGTDMIELRKLKISDIDEERNIVNINLKDYNKNRNIEVSNRFVDLAYKAYNQKTYILNNGEEVHEDFRRTNADYTLEESDYILKKSNIGRIIRNEPITKPTLYKRLGSIKNFQTFKSIDKYYLKFNNIYKSGAIWKAAKYIEERKMEIESMDKHDWNEVAMFVANTYQDLPTNIKSVINEENITELYYSKEK